MSISAADFDAPPGVKAALAAKAAAIAAEKAKEAANLALRGCDDRAVILLEAQRALQTQIAETRSECQKHLELAAEAARAARLAAEAARAARPAAERPGTPASTAKSPGLPGVFDGIDFGEVTALKLTYNQDKRGGPRYIDTDSDEEMMIDVNRSVKLSSLERVGCFKINRLERHERRIIAFLQRQGLVLVIRREFCGWRLFARPHAVREVRFVDDRRLDVDVDGCCHRVNLRRSSARGVREHLEIVLGRSIPCPLPMLNVSDTFASIETFNAVRPANAKDLVQELRKGWAKERARIDGRKAEGGAGKPPAAGGPEGGAGKP